MKNMLFLQDDEEYLEDEDVEPIEEDEDEE